MLDWIYWLGSTIFVYGGSLFAVGLISLYFFQDYLLYLPNGKPFIGHKDIVPSKAYKSPDANPQGLRNPGDKNLKFQDITIKTRDNVKIRGWMILHENSFAKDTIIFFHQNAGSMRFQIIYHILDIGTRLPFVEQLYHYCQANVILVAYRGYSNSQGAPSQAGLQIDAESVFIYAKNQPLIDPSRLYLFGRSLGGAVSIQLAQKIQGSIKGIIIQNTFTNISNMVNHIFPFLRYFKWLVLRNYWPSIDRIKNLRVPIMFISGTADTLVPPAMLKILYNEANQSAYKTFYEVNGGQHNDSWYVGGMDYSFSIRNFMDQAKKYNVEEKELKVKDADKKASSKDL